VPDEPAFGDRAINACPKFVAAAAGLEERRVDELDVDAAVLRRLDRAGISTSLRAATSGSAKGRSGTNFIAVG
jgi:hypothetical protein